MMNTEGTPLSQGIQLLLSKDPRSKQQLDELLERFTTKDIKERAARLAQFQPKPLTTPAVAPELVFSKFGAEFRAGSFSFYKSTSTTDVLLGEITRLREDENHNKFAHMQRLVRPEDTPQGRQPFHCQVFEKSMHFFCNFDYLQIIKREYLMTNDQEEIPFANIKMICSLEILPEDGVPVPEDAYCCRKGFDIQTGQIVPLSAVRKRIPPIVPTSQLQSFQPPALPPPQQPSLATQMMAPPTIIGDDDGFEEEVIEKSDVAPPIFQEISKPEKRHIDPTAEAAVLLSMLSGVHQGPIVTHSQQQQHHQQQQQHQTKKKKTS